MLRRRFLGIGAGFTELFPMESGALGTGAEFTKLFPGSLTPQIPERRLQPYFFGQIQIPYFS